MLSLASASASGYRQVVVDGVVVVASTRSQAYGRHCSATHTQRRAEVGEAEDEEEEEASREALGTRWTLCESAT